MAKLYGWKCKFCGDYTGFLREGDDGGIYGKTEPPVQCSCGSTEFKKEDLTDAGD